MLNKIYKADKNFQKLIAATTIDETIDITKPCFYEIGENFFYLNQFACCGLCEKNQSCCKECFSVLKCTEPKENIIRSSQLNFQVVK